MCSQWWSAAAVCACADGVAAFGGRVDGGSCGRGAEDGDDDDDEDDEDDGKGAAAEDDDGDDDDDNGDDDDADGAAPAPAAAEVVAMGVLVALPDAAGEDGWPFKCRNKNSAMSTSHVNRLP